MKAVIIQLARHEDDARKTAAIIEMDGVRFFSVTPGSADEARKINEPFKSARMIMHPKGLKWIPKEV